MRRRLTFVTLTLCALFAAFCLGYFLAGRTRPGTFSIVATPQDQPDNLPAAVSAAPPPVSTVPPSGLEAEPALGAESETETETGTPDTPAGPAIITGPEDKAAVWQPVNINRATAEELTDLPGVGPVLAERIIAWRTEHGGFSDPSQLMEVSGIGEKRYAQLKDLITTG
ncbi:MAG: helix-hairpin-helix domain-containing protein [Oscillospiraceae bacterium]|nr:helix-hairpin-helix domain-containing protein [Oscillospiraceae bacterium]